MGAPNQDDPKPDPLTVVIDGVDGDNRVHGVPGGTFTLTATAGGGKPDYTYAWTFEAGDKKQTSSGRAFVIAELEAKHAGTYTVTVTDTAQASASAHATLDVTSPPPTFWHGAFAGFTAVFLLVLAVIAAGPVAALGWREATHDKVSPVEAQDMVAAMLVTAGVVSLLLGAFLMLVDYRGQLKDAAHRANVVTRLLRSVAVRAPRGAAGARTLTVASGAGAADDSGAGLGDTIGKALDASGRFVQGFGALRSAATLALVAVAAFFAAAWVARGASSGSATPSPSSSVAPSASVAPASTAAPSPSP